MAALKLICSQILMKPNTVNVSRLGLGNRLLWSRSGQTVLSVALTEKCSNGTSRPKYTDDSLRNFSNCNSARFYSTKRATRPTKSKRNYYDVLGLTPKATHAQIKTSFYKLSKQFHPDVNKDPEAQEKFAEISEAYEVLGTKRTRHMYDRGMYRGTTTSTSSDYTGDEDIPPEEFWKRQTFKERKPPPMGRTQMYNFDEFYRKHYGESIKRTKMSKEKMEDHMKNLEDMDRQNLAAVRALACFALLGIVTLWKLRDQF